MDDFGMGKGGMGGMDGAPPPEEDFSKQPIEDRLKSKVWKARVSAYEELSSGFRSSPSEDAPIFRPYTRNADAVRAMALDSNAVAQEKAVLAIRDFVELGGRAAGQTRETVLPALVDKCLGSTRAGTKKAATEAILFYIENEDVMGSEGAVLDLLKGTDAKQPKLALASVSVLKDAVRLFGPKQVRAKPILVKLPGLFGHADKAVRAEAALLAQELHRWIGPSLEPTLASLKEIQAKELRAQLETAGPAYTQPERNLLSQKAAAEAAAAAAAGASAAGGEEGEEDGDAEDAPPADPLRFVEPEDPTKAPTWPANFDEMVVSKKWQERKDTVEAVLASLTPKIQASNALDGVVDALALRLAKDVNINVVLAACQALTGLAKGLRGGFAKYREKVLPLLLEKLKEKKESTVKVLRETLDAIFQTVTFSDILEDTLAATKHKNPAVKTEATLYIVRCLAETRAMPAKGDIKPIAETLKVAMDDASADVRDAGAQGLGTLMKLIGERPMNQFIDSLDDIKKGKVQDQFKVATVQVKATPAAAPRAPAAAAPKARAPPAKKPPAPIANKENSPPMRSASPARPPAAKAAPPRLAAKKPAAAAAAPRPVAKAGPSGARPTGKAPASATEPVKYRFSSDDAEMRANDLIPENIRTQVASSNWKERLQGMTDLSAWLNVEAAEAESEIIVRFLGKKPGWKESNFQVLAELYKCLRLLADECPTFGRASVALSVQPLCDKLGDIKLKGPAGDTLTLYAEKTSFGFVLNQALAPLAALKAPKAIADSLVWMNTAILEFGTSGLDVRSVIEFLITGLKSANAAVRTNATTTISTIARFMGTTITTFIGDLNPQLQAIVQSEIEKAASNPAPAPIRFSGEAQARAGGGKGGAAGGGGAAEEAPSAADDEEALDALIPRVDVDKMIPSSSVTLLSSANWKERKEGLEAIAAVLDANPRLKGTLSELSGPLKARYSDSNMAVRTLALDVLAKIATGMGKSFEPLARTFSPPVTQVLADAKVPIRAAASATLTAMATASGVAALIPGFGSVLDSKAANPMLRQELFTWLGAWFEEHMPEKSMDLQPLALPAVQCLDDKLAAVRKAAQATLPFIIMRAGYKFVLEQANSLKAASRNTVVPLIDAAKAQAAAKAPKAAPPPAAAPRAAAPVARPAAVVAAAASGSSSPRSASPARPTSLARPSAMKPRTAVVRSLKAPASSRPQSTVPSSDDYDAPSGLAAPSGFKSKLGTAAPRKASAPTASSSAIADKSAPFASADPKFKAAREKKEGRGQHWIGPEGNARPELNEVLRLQCEHHLSNGLVDSMFSKDHNAERDYLSALTLLSDFISSPAVAEEDYDLSQSEATQRVVANSDLLFKYVALRLTDNNTSISLKCLEVLDHLVNLLVQEQYLMSDYEASCLFPCLVAKFGDPKVAFRDRIREIFRKLAPHIFPASKLLAHFVESGLPSKNAKVRTECLGELGYILARNGLQVCAPAKTLPVIAKQIADRDASVRTAALMALGEAYQLVGDDVWKYVGTLSAKDKSLLEERLKRTAAPGANRKPAAAASAPRSSIAPAPSAAAAPPPSKMAAPSRLARPSSMAMPSGMQPPSASVKSRLPAPGGGASGIARAQPAPVVHNEVSEEFEPVHGEVEEAEDEAGNETFDPDDDLAVEQTINEILSSDPARSVAALKVIEGDIAEQLPQLAHHADQLIIVLSKQIHRAFLSGDATPANQRLQKHLLLAVAGVFEGGRFWDDKPLGWYVSKTAFVSLLTEVLQRLIEQSAKTDPESVIHAKYINISVLRSFSTCKLNVLFSACLTMLKEAAEDMDDLEGELLTKRSKFAELIIKCLWKIARRLPDSLGTAELDAPALLMDVEDLLQSIPPTEWRRRGAENLPLADVPLRTCKAILVHYCTVLGEDVLGMLDGLPEPENSYVYSYLIRMLNRAQPSNDAPGPDLPNEEAMDDMGSADGDELGRSRPSSITNNVTSPPLSPSRLARRTRTSQASASADTTAESDVASAELREIFEKISRKDESRQGIRDLYSFQKRYPDKNAQVERALQSTGPIFQRYIQRALANHAAEDADAAPASSSAAAAVTLSPTGSARSSVVGTTGDRPASLSRSSFMGETPASPPSHTRSSTGEDRLATLRAKFAAASGASDDAPSTNAAPGMSRVVSSGTSEALRAQLASLRNGA